MDKASVEHMSREIDLYGKPVFDDAGRQIGTVQEYDLPSGWMQIEKGLFFPEDRYIPVSAISRIDPSGIYLSVSKDYVKDAYSRPPTVKLDVVAGPGGDTAVGTVASGYDGSRVDVNSLTINPRADALHGELQVQAPCGLARYGDRLTQPR
jgi:hypothetical protein